MAAPHILFLTGRLAEAELRAVLEALQNPAFNWEIRTIGQVAALMTTTLVKRRLPQAIAPAQRIVVPGRAALDLEALRAHFCVPIEKGPDDLIDLPDFLGYDAATKKLDDYRIQILAEIIDSVELSVEENLKKADYYRQQGANIIDLGVTPEHPFPHLEDTIAALKQAGHKVSVDSMQTALLQRADKAGADYLLSLTEEHVSLAADLQQAIPVLIPRNKEERSLHRAASLLLREQKPFIADPILDPIHFGFAASLQRYGRFRKEFPTVPMMMGVGNLTELTEADSNGVNALLIGIMSELDIDYMLTTQVSGHCRHAIREAALARRIMYRAKCDKRLPVRLHTGLCALHERRPFPRDADTIARMAHAVRDKNYRIQLSAQGIHLYNRDRHLCDSDAKTLFSALPPEPFDHSFYLGYELAKAEIAWTLGKRYQQDQPLHWGESTLPYEAKKTSSDDAKN